MAKLKKASQVKRVKRFLDVKRGTRLEIVWEDAHGTSAWTDANETPPEVLVRSIGFLIRSTKTGIVLAHGLPVGNTDSMCGASFIPHGMVREIRRLK